MDWKKLLGSIAASVDEELRLRHAYLAAENRILRQQITGRVHLTHIGPQTGHRADMTAHSRRGVHTGQLP